jgi:hypothetical protein
MTPRRLALPPVRRVLSLRVTLLAVALGAGVYAAALPVYLFVRVSRPALALGSATQAIATLSADIAQRDSALNRAVAIVRTLARSPLPAPDSLQLAHRLLAVGRAPLPVAADAPLPQPLRVELERIDAALAQLGRTLAALVDQLGRGRRADVAARLQLVEQLLQIIHERRADGTRVARGYLMSRQRALAAAAAEVRRDAIVWFGLGLVLALGLSASRSTDPMSSVGWPSTSTR